MIGQTVSHYKILEKLGEGGMGVVYKAEDLKLKRTVALKFLPHHLSSTPEEEARFLQEAQAAATLNHPNVCTIYDIKEHENQQFIVMECIDGVTLRKKIASGPLPLNQAVAYGLQIGDALQEAHSKGIVHRDIKADNIMVNTKNNIKVMDFGLAKLKGSLKLTRASSTVGTLAYMAPEQIQGGEVDARSDIFSFGVVLFETLTGHLPFRGDHEAALMYSIINEEPEPLDKYLPEAPSELLHIFSRALDKNPEDRYQSVHDMVIDLRRLKKESTRVSRASMPVMPLPVQQSGPVAAPPPTQPLPAVQEQARKRWLIPSAIAAAVVVLGVAAYLFLRNGASDNGERLPVAVADFVNQTGEKELDGLSGMLITAMEQSRRLSVLTRSGMFDILKAMGTTNVDKIDESLGKAICNQANIGALVTASIRKFGKLYTIDLKVLDPRKNEYIFTAKEEGEGQENIPAMLDRLSEKTRIGLKDQAVEAKTAKLAVVTTTNMEAYQHFFSGEQLINRLKFDEAEKEFGKAIELDSMFALAWYRLGYTLDWSAFAKDRARPVIEKALLLINRLPEKEQYLLRALDAEQSNRSEQAVLILREMEKIYPDEKEMIYNIGDWSFHAGDYASASAYLEKVLKVDPTSERALQHLTWTYRALAQYDKMLDAATRYVAASGSLEARTLLRDTYVYRGELDQAMKTMLTARELLPAEYSLTRRIAEIHMLKGNYAQAETELKALLAASMPAAAKKAGYGGLANHYAFLGRMQEWKRMIDERLKLATEEKDTAGIINNHLFRFIVHWNVRKNPQDAKKELELIAPLQPARRPPSVGNLTLVCAYLGDVAAVDSLARPFLKFVRQGYLSIAYGARHECELEATLLDSAMRIGTVPDFLALGYYGLAECQFEAGQFDKAFVALNKLFEIKELPRTSEYPFCLLLRGKLYDKKGDRKLAVENYENFLSVWKDADKDLPDYIDAKARLANLRKVASK
jgi:tetratricopeptide (TPR) repeat protein